jgi:hypothetical protein
MNDDEYDDAIAKAAADALIAQQEDAPKDILDEVPPVPQGAAPEPVESDLEPFRPMIAALGRGEIEIRDAAPAEPPPPQPEDIAGYHERLSRPGASAILRQINDYAAVSSSEEAAKLAGDHRAFNAAFDKFFEANRPAQPPTQPAETKRIIDSILKRKETLAQAARSERAGTVVGSEAFGGNRQERSREQEMAALKQRIRRNPGDTDLQAQLAKYYLGDD